jgi:hypothetical protein
MLKKISALAREMEPRAHFQVGTCETLGRNGFLWAPPVRDGGF